VQAGADLLHLQASPVRLAYPLVEAEIVRRRRALLVESGDGDPQTRQANYEIMRWRGYVAAPIVVTGRVVGFFEGDRPAGPEPLSAIDREALDLFARRFAQIFERAALRRRLRIQQHEMRRVASWADSRTSELSDRAIDLASERSPTDGDTAPSSQATTDGALADLLTRREIDVLKLMVKGETNAGIARALVISEGTVKFHVKNVLRKMQASNRADASSRYLRLTLGSAPLGPPDAER
jgi:DNA-binding CsgD family transcriptional regulator